MAKVLLRVVKPRLCHPKVETSRQGGRLGE